MTRAIEVFGLKYGYPGTGGPALVLDKLAIDPGEICWVAGLTGAGKSTFCRVLAGLIPHFFRGRLSGSVKIFGQEITELNLSAITGMVGLVTGDPFEQLTRATYTVRDEIAFGLQNVGLPVQEIIRRVAEIMGELEITSLADRLPTSLSLGEQQRVVIASILARQPQVFVVDEATSLLDPQGSEAFYRLAARLKSSGHTVVVVEPKPDRIYQAADRLILLQQGQMVAQGRVGELVNRGVFEQAGLSLPTYPALGKMLHVNGGYSGKLPVGLSEACEMVDQILYARR